LPGQQTPVVWPQRHSTERHVCGSSDHGHLHLSQADNSDCHRRQNYEIDSRCLTSSRRDQIKRSPRLVGFFAIRSLISQQVRLTLLAAFTSWYTWIAADGDLAADQSRDTSCHRDRDLSRNTFGTSCHPGFTNLTAGCVGNLASAGLLNHPAAGVRNLFGDTMCFHPALGVRNLLRDAVVRPGAGCIRNPLPACLSHHAADRIRHLL
jgi:hypothetical protein